MEERAWHFIGLIVAIPSHENVLGKLLGMVKIPVFGKNIEN